MIPRPTSRVPEVRTALVLAVISSVVSIWGCTGAGGGPQGFDGAALERAEDLSESLANDLLALSVGLRERDEGVLGAHLAARVEATPGWDTVPQALPWKRWIVRRSWSFDERVVAHSADGMAGEFAALFWRFPEIDDVRFKVKRAEFRGPRGGRADVKFFLVGRDESLRREWLRGQASLEVVRDGDGPWQIRRIELHALESLSSEVDLFSEVAAPAGVAATFPAFGEGRNQGFVSHGAAAADIDNDGRIDLAASGVDQNYLYRNAGDGTFEDVGASSLVKFAPIGSGALFLDYDNDGDADLFFAAVGRQVLFENRFVPEGQVSFWDVSERAGVALPAVGFSAVSADVNSDGYPDIYVCSYNHYGTVMPDSWHRATNGTPNLLFLNRGDGTFEEVAESWGVADARWSYAAGFVDIDADGDQDLYVANDFGENALYVNRGDRFVDEAERRGIVDPGFGMGVSFGDYDNDGDLDLHVTNMSSTAGNRILKLLYPEQHAIRKALSKQAAGNSLYENLGDGTFRDVTPKIGGLPGGWAFGGGFVDFDNDGWEDLYTPNGFVSGKSMKDT